MAPIHPDATPVLLLEKNARGRWLNAPMEEALLLQKPPPAGALKVVAAGAKEDGLPGTEGQSTAQPSEPRPLTLF